MTRFVAAGVVALVATAGGSVGVQAHRTAHALAVVMTNDVAANEVKVYDSETNTLVQTLSANGRGGVGGNARGVKQYGGDVVAVVNNGSNSVAMFRRIGGRLRFDQLVSTTSAPVSVDFGNGHMYVAGASSVDSFVLRRGRVEWMDGTTVLTLAEGGVPPAGSTAQVGVVDGTRLLVTLKSDPTPGTVDVVALKGGAITGSVAAIPAPAGTLTPFGFSVYDDGTAVITLAHSGQDGLFRDGAFADVIASGESAPCWTTAVGKYVFTANTASRSISRLIGTGAHIFVDAPVAAAVATGAPSDLDAAAGVVGVVDHAAGQSHLTLFSYNAFGELAPRGTAISIGVANANGVAIVPAPEPDEE